MNFLDHRSPLSGLLPTQILNLKNQELQKSPHPSPLESQVSSFDLTVAIVLLRLHGRNAWFCSGLPEARRQRRFAYVSRLEFLGEVLRVRP